MTSKYIMARSPNTSPETLDRLANDEDNWIRCYVVENPNTLPETLARLADDKHGGIRCLVTQNPNTPHYAKEYLTAVNFWRRCYES
jgi:hypothetical protein